MELPDIKIVVEGDAINPGIYTKYRKGGWTAKEISLVEGENFEEGSLYLLTGYETRYRKDEYNSIDYVILKADTSGNSVVYKSSGYGVMYPNKAYIQKLVLSGNIEEGFIISLTPQSEKTFKVID